MIKNNRKEQFLVRINSSATRSTREQLSYLVNETNHIFIGIESKETRFPGLTESHSLADGKRQDVAL